MKGSDQCFRLTFDGGALDGGRAHAQLGLTHPELFNYVGIFSIGLINPQQAADYETRNAAALDKASKSMKLVYYAIGEVGLPLSVLGADASDPRQARHQARLQRK